MRVPKGALSSADIFNDLARLFPGLQPWQTSGEVTVVEVDCRMDLHLDETTVIIETADGHNDSKHPAGVISARVG